MGNGSTAVSGPIATLESSVSREEHYVPIISTAQKTPPVCSSFAQESDVGSEKNNYSKRRVGFAVVINTPQDRRVREALQRSPSPLRSVSY